MIPKYFDLSTQKYDLVEFEKSFYGEIFKDRNLIMKDKDFFRLRLCAFVDMKDNRVVKAPLKQYFTGRYVSVMITDRFLEDHKGDSYNYDM